MYEESFGMDWEAIDREEALRRAYALGVAKVIDDAPLGELDRLRGEVTGRYAESMIDLAYNEGVAEAEGLRDERDESAVWESLVEDESDVTDRIDPLEADRAPRPTDRPSVVDLPSAVEAGDRDDLGKLDLPDLLR